MKLIAAYLIVGISFSPAHQSVDAIEYPAGMAACLDALASMKAEIAKRPTTQQSRLTFAPKCVDERPAWWVTSKPESKAPSKVAPPKRLKIPGYVPPLPVPRNWVPDGKGGYKIGE